MAREDDMVNLLREIRDLMRELVQNQRMGILKERTAANRRDRALEETISDLYAYIQHHGLLSGRAWWVTADSVLYRDLKALLSRHQQSDVPLAWGDMVASLSLHTPSPERDRALELVDYMVRKEAEEQRRV
ncbi:MAG: hypothetical protein HY689_02705 [Chloroflexi bacterium]|nr:hypothetical protein [Chloroflexota bacterium]